MLVPVRVSVILGVLQDGTLAGEEQRAAALGPRLRLRGTLAGARRAPARQAGGGPALRAGRRVRRRRALGQRRSGGLSGSWSRRLSSPGGWTGPANAAFEVGMAYGTNLSADPARGGPPLALQSSASEGHCRTIGDLYMRNGQPKSCSGSKRFQDLGRVGVLDEVRQPSVTGCPQMRKRRRHRMPCLPVRPRVSSKCHEAVILGYEIVNFG